LIYEKAAQNGFWLRALLALLQNRGDHLK